MAKYGKKAGEKVERAMKERNSGTLKSGKSGKKVTSRKQAIAIGLSEARKEDAKVPAKKSSSAGKSPAAKKSAAKKASAATKHASTKTTASSSARPTAARKAT